MGFGGTIDLFVFSFCIFLFRWRWTGTPCHVIKKNSVNKSMLRVYNVVLLAYYVVYL